MEILSVPRLLIAGTGTGVGKSLVTTGLALVLRSRGVSVSCAVVRPALLQAVIYNRLTRRSVHCFDPQLLSPGQALRSLYQCGVGSDLILIDGHAGLYDGMEPRGTDGSDADLAAHIGAATVLTVDVSSFAASVAALVKGFVEYSSGFEVAGMVGNRHDLSRAIYGQVLDAQYYRSALATLESVDFYGSLPHDSQFDNVLPHSFLRQDKNRISLDRQFYVHAAQVVDECLDIDAIVETATRSVTLRLQDFENAPQQRRCKIALADDSCFCVSFQDNIDLLKYYGAEVRTFSLLADDELPSGIGGVYIPGGFLLEYGQELSQNHSMMESLRHFVNAGGVVYSEGSGTAFLCERIVPADEEEIIEGVGIIRLEVVCAPYSLSYETFILAEDSVLGSEGTEVRGVMTGEWKPRSPGAEMRVLRVVHEDASEELEGFSPSAQMIATFGFLHWGSQPEIAKSFVDACEVVEGM